MPAKMRGHTNVATKILAIASGRLTRKPVNKKHHALNNLPLSGYRVLVVEDNRINRHLLILQLSELGADIDEAEDGKTAVDIFSKRRPDAVVLDMRLRQETGLDVARNISSLAGSKPVPFIMLSATKNLLPLKIHKYRDLSLAA